jgi:CheY-like chemotaxis protein
MNTILVADDCANIREFCKQELEEEGYRVLLARDGKEAVDMVQSGRPDLAVLDIWMPRINGLEAAERIAAIDSSIRVILFTNNDDLCLSDPRSAFAAACIEKSDDFTDLKRTVASLLTARNGNDFVRVGLPPIRRNGSGMPCSRRPGVAQPERENR